MERVSHGSVKMDNFTNDLAARVWPLVRWLVSGSFARLFCPLVACGEVVLSSR